MSEKTKEVGVRLSVKDADVVRKALQSVGTDGAKALGLIDNAARRANPSLVNLSNGIQRSKTYAREFAVEASRSFLGPVAAIATAAGAVELLRDSVEQVNKLAENGDLAERIGVDVAKLQGLQATFRESGDDTGELNAALQTFAVNLAKAASGAGDLKKVFDQNGVKITGNTLTDLKNYADLVKNARDEQQKLQLVTLAFGKGSKELVDLVGNGSEAVSHMADEAERLGTASSSLDVQTARDFVKEFAIVNIKLDDAKLKFAELIAPGELAALGAFNDFLRDTRNLLTDISHLDLKGIAKIIGEDRGNPSLFGKNGAFAIDWFGNGSVVSGNRELLPAQGANSHLQDIHDTRDGEQVSATTGSGRGATAKTTTLDLSSTSTADARAKAIKSVTDALDLQIKNLTATNREQEVNNELSKAHVTLADKEGPAIAALAGRYYDQKEAIDAVNDATALLAQTGEGIFGGLIDDTKSWNDILGDTVTSLEKAVLQAALLGTGPLAGLFGTKSDTAGGTGGVLGTLLGGIIGALAPKTGSAFTGGFGSTAFGGRRAGGGPVNAGVGYMVGENGPEPFIPKVPGHILPNSALRIGGQGDLTVNVQIVHQPGTGQDSATATKQGNKLQITATVGDVVASHISTPGSAPRVAIQKVFGVRPQLTQR